MTEDVQAAVVAVAVAAAAGAVAGAEAEEAEVVRANECPGISEEADRARGKTEIAAAGAESNGQTAIEKAENLDEIVEAPLADINKSRCWYIIGEALLPFTTKLKRY